MTTQTRETGGILSAACAAVVIYLVVALGLDTLAARAGLQHVFWPHIGAVVWVIRGVGLLMGGLGWWLVRRYIVSRRRVSRIVASVLAALLLLVLAGLGGAWYMFGAWDSDCLLVSAQMVNSQLPLPLHLPNDARDVRAWITGGISPRIYVRFCAPAPVLQEYERAAFLLQEKMGGHNKDPHPLWMPSDLLDKDWWTPSGHAASVWRADSDYTLFCQVDAPRETAYVVWGDNW